MNTPTALNPALTPGAAKVLRMMIEQGEELVADGLSCWVGDYRTSRTVMKHLLSECLIRPGGEGSIYYRVTPDAAQVLADPAYETRWREAQRTGRPVHR